MARILVVDQDPSAAKLTLLALRRSGVAMAVDVANDGAEALRLLGDVSPPLPTLVLLALRLPKVDGYAVLRRLRAEPRTRRLPVVVLTDSLDAADVARSYDLGANGCVYKPVDFTAFAAAVAVLCAFWLGVNEPPPAVYAHGLVG